MKLSFTGGGVVIGPDKKILVVNQRGTSWSLPKGVVEQGESAEQAARREIREESGISELKLIKELGSFQRHPMAKDPTKEVETILKDITIFLYTTTQTDLQPEDLDNPEARWVELSEVEDLLTHPKDKAFFASIKSQLQT